MQIYYTITDLIKSTLQENNNKILRNYNSNLSVGSLTLLGSDSLAENVRSCRQWSVDEGFG